MLIMSSPKSQIISPGSLVTETHSEILTPMTVCSLTMTRSRDHENTSGLSTISQNWISASPRTLRISQNFSNLDIRGFHNGASGSLFWKIWIKGWSS